MDEALTTLGKTIVAALPGAVTGFQVERSEAEYGPYEAICAEMADRFVFRDTNIPVHNLSRTLWYRLRVRNLRTNEVSVGQPFNRRGPLSLEGAEASRQFSVYVRRGAGQRFWLLPVRTFGQTCPVCTNSMTGRQQTRDCSSCWGTRFTGGYHYPVATWGTLQEAEGSLRATAQASQQVRHLGIECEGSPEIHEGDLIIDRLNRRFRILVPTATTRHQCIVHQKAQIVQIQPSQVEFTIPVGLPTDGEDLPPDLFSLPATLENLAGESAASLLGSRNW